LAIAFIASAEADAPANSSRLDNRGRFMESPLAASGDCGHAGVGVEKTG
jgi:hypothetical protein